MTAPEQPTPTPEARALIHDICPNDFGGGPCDYPACWESRCEFWKSGDKIIVYAAQRVAQAAEQAERVGRGLELNAIACFLEGWTASGPPGWQNAARTLAHHVRNGAHRDARAPTPPPGDAGERARAFLRGKPVGAGDGDTYVPRPIGAEELAAFIQSERTAAASQARRETIEECAALLDQRKTQWDNEHNRGHHCSLTVQNELGASAAIIRALATPQESAS